MCELRRTIATALVLAVFSITCARNPKTPANASSSQACQGLRLGDSALTPELADGLVRCLNRENRIEPWAELFTEIPREDFETLVKFVDAEIVSDTNTRHQWIQTYEYLEKQGLKKEFFSLIESVFRDPAVLIAFKNLAVSFFDEKTLHEEPLIPFFLKDYEDRDFHKTLNLVSEVLETPAALSLMGHSRESLSLENIAQLYRGYFEKGSKYGKGEVGRQLLQALRDGSFFKMVHESLGEEGEAILERTQKMAVLSDVSYRDNAKFTTNAVNLIVELNDKRPKCARGAFELYNPVLLSFFELASKKQEDALQLVRRDFELQCYFLKNICDVDEATQKRMEELFDYLHQPQFPYFHELVLIFKDHQLLQRMADLIASPAMSSHVVPLMGALYDEKSFPNWLLLLNIWSADQEKSMEKFATELLQPNHDWSGKSAYDLLLDRLEKVPVSVWFEIATAFHKLNEESARDGVRWSQFWQRVSLVTHEHPVEDFIAHLLQEVSSNVQLRKAVYRIVSHPKFDDAIRFFSQSASTGTLEDVLGFLATAFKKTAEREKTQSLSWTNSAVVPASELRHRFAAEDVLGYRSSRLNPTQTDYSVCRNLNSRKQAFECLQQPGSSSIWVSFWQPILESNLFDQAKEFIEATLIQPSELNALWQSWVMYREDEFGDQWFEWLRLTLKQGWFKAGLEWWNELGSKHALERALFLEALTKNLNEGLCALPEKEFEAIKTGNGWVEFEKTQSALEQDSDYALLDWETMKQDWQTACESRPEVRAELVRFLNSKWFSELLRWVKTNPELASQVLDSLEKGLAEPERLEVVNRLERWLD